MSYYSEEELNYYFDMDGVLVPYEREAYEGDHPLFIQPQQHYFRWLSTDKLMVAFANYLLEKGKKVYVITSVKPDSVIFNEHLHDKYHWLDVNMPLLDRDNVFFCVTTKSDCASYIQSRKLSRRDVLVDDFNRNLVEWEKSGGTAIKYLNGLNSPESFSGYTVDHTLSFDALCESFITLQNKLKEGA